MPETRFRARHAEAQDDRSQPAPHRRFAVRRADVPERAARRRNAWRQRMIDAERGLRLVLRMDGTMFAHLFAASCVLAAGFLLGLTSMQWAIVTLAITVVLSAETFNQLLRALWSEAGHHLPSLRNVVKIGAAALLLTSIGAGTAIVLVFVERLRRG